MYQALLGIEDRHFRVQGSYCGVHNLVSCSFVCPTSGDVRLGNFDETSLQNT